MGSLISEAINSLTNWIEGERFQGWDPYDALNSPIVHYLTFGNRRLGQAWVHLLKQSPVNLRPLLGVPKGYNPKGIGLLAQVFVNRSASLFGPGPLFCKLVTNQHFSWL
jgi:hypothetical protein